MKIVKKEDMKDSLIKNMRSYLENQDVNKSHIDYIISLIQEHLKYLKPDIDKIRKDKLFYYDTELEIDKLTGKANYEQMEKS